MILINVLSYLGLLSDVDIIFSLLFLCCVFGVIFLVYSGFALDMINWFLGNEFLQKLNSSLIRLFLERFVCNLKSLRN